MRAGRHRGSRTRSSTSPRCSATAPRNPTAAPSPVRPPPAGALGAAGRTRLGRGRPDAWLLPHRPARPAEVPVSILIPFRDEPRLLRTCVDSIAATTGSHASVELVLDRQRVHRPRDARRLWSGWPRDPTSGSWPIPGPSTGPRSTTPGRRPPRAMSCSSSTTTSRRARPGGCRRCAPKRSGPTSAAVGARLLYPDGRLQHCGLVVGLTGAAGHVLGGLDE